MKRLFIDRRNLKATKLFILGIVIFIAAGFRSPNFTSENQKAHFTSHGSDNSNDIEVFTSQQLFVVRKHQSQNGKIIFKAELRDAFKALRYATNNDSAKLETGWLLSSTYGVFAPGVYKQGHAEFDKLKNIILKKNVVH